MGSRSSTVMGLKQWDEMYTDCTLTELLWTKACAKCINVNLLHAISHRVEE